MNNKELLSVWPGLSNILNEKNDSKIDNINDLTLKEILNHLNVDVTISSKLDKKILCIYIDDYRAVTFLKKLYNDGYLSNLVYIYDYKRRSFTFYFKQTLATLKNYKDKSVYTTVSGIKAKVLTNRVTIIKSTYIYNNFDKKLPTIDILFAKIYDKKWAAFNGVLNYFDKFDKEVNKQRAANLWAYVTNLKWGTVRFSKFNKNIINQFQNDHEFKDQDYERLVQVINDFILEKPLNHEEIDNLIFKSIKSNEYYKMIKIKVNDYKKLLTFDKKSIDYDKASLFLFEKYKIYSKDNIYYVWYNNAYVADGKPFKLSNYDKEHFLKERIEKGIILECISIEFFMDYNAWILDDKLMERMSSSAISKIISKIKILADNANKLNKN
ncbi:hypothetical protein KQ876_03480 [Mycoplasma sp. CSL7491-lung]|uniref:hypothetical protein n=1 Tax=Mycoplasma sp. CSL7491-lung TaxID=549718 RepID=UPI001C0FD4EB|nr:hypothetical protein [Mycoplasma sp. CSL7491-lung]MBU4693249.1 hypothetical protein [Mycoplasma sp. CSL7491-lung]